MAESKLFLQLGEIPEDGVSLQGELNRNVFDLRDRLARPLSNLRYDLQARITDGYLVLQGQLEAEFELVCGRTTKGFSHTVHLAPYTEAVELENSEFLDLTDQLREDILLALPAYPRAPGSDEEDDLPLVGSDSPAQSEESRRSEWDALDGLETND